MGCSLLRGGGYPCMHGGCTALPSPEHPGGTRSSNGIVSEDPMLYTGGSAPPIVPPPAIPPPTHTE